MDNLRLKQLAGILTEDDLASRRSQKQDNTVGNVLVDIDQAVSAAMDHLITKGMDESAAKRAVMKHLSDLVMAHDLG